MPDNRTTVFVIDDDSGIRNSVRRLLTSVEMHVVTCRTAQEFLDGLDPETPGCVILDVRLPGMCGTELQRRLAASDEPLPVIIVTGHADVPLTTRVMRLGALAVLEKPFAPEELIELVREAIEIDVRARAARAP